ncbi:hypothetical protein C2S51_013554 [Perilla frutescens var. frutescens]|nr:hypothetical protein C2S51_013554 [Perilla frutescens var. frutescens]
MKTAKTKTAKTADEEEICMEIRDAPPAHLLIKILSFSKLSKHESREFVAGNYKWRLTIYPNGRERERENEGDHISVYLCVAEEDIDDTVGTWEVNAKCSILLHNQISDNYFCYQGKTVRLDAMNSKWGVSISKRILRDPSNGYLVDDKFVFGAEVFVSEKTTPPPAAAAIDDQCLRLLDWKISDFSKLEGVWYSEVFRVGGLRWKLQLYPNGNNSGKGKSVSIYLVCVECKSFAPHEKVKANFCIRIRNNLPHHSHRYKFTSYLFKSGGEFRSWGFANFISISDMGDPSKGFIVNDCCFLDMEIYLQDVVFTPKYNNPLFQLH